MPFYGGVRACAAVWCEDQGEAHTVPLGLEDRSKFKELLAAGAPRHPIGRFRPRRPGGSGTFSNFELWAPEVAVLGLLAVLAKNFLGALRAQSEGQGNLSMHPQGDNLYGYGPTTHFLAYFRLVLGATNTPMAPAGPHGPPLVPDGRWLHPVDARAEPEASSKRLRFPSMR